MLFAISLTGMLKCATDIICSLPRVDDSLRLWDIGCRFFTGPERSGYCRLGRSPRCLSAADVRRHFCRDRQVAGAAGASMRGAWSDLRRATAEKEVRPYAGKSAQVSIPVPPTARFDCPYRSKSAILVVRLAEITRKSVKIPGTNRALLLSGFGIRNESTSNIRSCRLACRNARHRPSRRMARQHRRTVSRLSAGKSGHTTEGGGRGVQRSGAANAFCRHQARFCGLPIRSKSAILVVRLAEITRKSVKIPGTNRALFTERLGDPE